MHRTTTSLLALLALAALATAASAQADKSAKGYRCAAKDAVRLQDDGSLGKDLAEVERNRFDGVVIDTLTGAISYADGKREIWEIVQDGGSENDHVLVQRSDYPRNVKRMAADAATDFIRIRAWDRKPQSTFMAFALSTLVTGTCDILR